MDDEANIERAREAVSRILKFRSIFIPKTQATITHKGTWNLRKKIKSKKHIKNTIKLF